MSRVVLFSLLCACGDPTITTPDAGIFLDAGCATLASGDYDRTLSWGGRTRTYHLHVPAGSAKPVPIVVAYHGGGGNSTVQEETMHLTAKSDTAGFVLVRPEGTGALPNVLTWNVGNCCGYAADNAVDDIGFTRAMLDAIAGEVCVDPKRVFVTGFSNGAMMAHRIACELSDRVAAIAPVSGGIGDFPCAPSRPVPVFEVHGLADRCYPFDGGTVVTGNTFISIPTTIAGWVARDDDDPTQTTVTFANGAATCETHACTGSGCADVTLCTIDNGGHAWPGSDQYKTQTLCGGVLSSDLKANDALWDFFVAHPMP